MQYLLDTNVLIAMFKGEHGIRESILKVGTRNCFISELTYGELLVGAKKGNNKKQKREVEYARGMFQMLPITTDVIERWAAERAFLEQLGKKVDSIDLLIASTALVEGLTIVTHNTKHFSRIQGLEVVDWEF